MFTPTRALRSRRGPAARRSPAVNLNGVLGETCIRVLNLAAERLPCFSQTLSGGAFEDVPIASKPTMLVEVQRLQQITIICCLQGYMVPYTLLQGFLAHHLTRLTRNRYRNSARVGRRWLACRPGELPAGRSLQTLLIDPSHPAPQLQVCGYESSCFIWSHTRQSDGACACLLR